MANNESRLSITVDSNKAESNVDDLKKALDALEKAGLRVTASVEKSNEKIKDTEKVSGESTAALRRMALQMVAGFSTMRVIDIADQWGQYASRIKMATQSAEEYDYVQKRMLQSANATFRSINETREGFIRMSPVLRSMGYELSESVDIVDSFSAMLVTNAASSERGASAMNAYSKSLQVGKLDSEGWQQIMAAMPTIVDRLTAATGESADKIRKLGVEGKLSVNALSQALLQSTSQNMAAVADMPTTVRDAMQNIGNAFQEFIGWNNESIGVTATLASGLTALGENFNTVAAVMLGVGAAAASKYVISMVAAQVASFSAAGAVSALATAARGLSAALMGPAGIAIAIGAAVTGLILWNQKSKETDGILKEMQGSLDGVIAKYKQMNADQRAGAMLDYTKAHAKAVDEADDAYSRLENSMVMAFANTGANGRQMKDLRMELQEARDTGQSMLPILERMAQVTHMRKGSLEHWISLNAEFADAKVAADKAGYALNELKNVNTGLATSVEATAAAEIKVKAEREEADKEAKERKKRIDDMVKSLRDEVATLGMSADEALRWRFEQEKAGAATLKTVDGLISKKQAHEQNVAAMQIETEAMIRQRNLQEEINLFRKQQDMPISGMGLGNQRREQIAAEFAIEQEFHNKRVDLTNKMMELERNQSIAGMKMDEATYNARIADMRNQVSELNAVESQKIQIVRDAAAQKEQAERGWLRGAKEAQENYLSEAKNLYKQAEAMTTNVFRSMEDSIVNLVKTGKISFASLADSIISDLARISARQAISGIFNSILGAFSGGSAVGSSSSQYSLAGGAGGGLGLKAGGFSSGGFTGNGGKYEPAGVVHKGEYVINAENTRRLGVPYLNSLNGYADGGYVGTPPPAGAGNTSVQINITNNSSQAVEAKETGRSVSMIDGLKQLVIGVVLEDQQRNGKMMQGYRRAFSG